MKLQLKFISFWFLSHSMTRVRFQILKFEISHGRERVSAYNFLETTKIYKILE